MMYDGTVMRNWSMGEYLLRRYQELSTFVVASSGKLPMSCASGRNSFGRKNKGSVGACHNGSYPFERPSPVLSANRDVSKSAGREESEWQVANGDWRNGFLCRAVLLHCPKNFSISRENGSEWRTSAGFIFVATDLKSVGEVRVKSLPSRKWLIASPHSFTVSPLPSFPPPALLL
jgi:hypothetical protein